MAKFIVELWMDGYNSEEEMEKACETFIEDQLDFSGSSVKIMKHDDRIKELEEQVETLQNRIKDIEEKNRFDWNRT